MHPSTPSRNDIIAAALIGLLEGIFFLVGDALSKQYGLLGGFAIIVFLNVLIYLVAAIGSR